MLPGGRGVLFTVVGDARQNSELAVLDMKSGQQKTLLPGGSPWSTSKRAISST